MLRIGQIDRIENKIEELYQPDSPVGLDLKLLKRALEEPPKIPKDPSRMVPERLSFRVSPGL